MARFRGKAPAGVGGGGRQQAGSGGGFNLNWDGSWEIATSRDTAGWYAEFRIPFSTLRYGNARTQEWGINFARQIRRRNETAFWSPIPRQFDLYRVSLAGALQGIEPPARRLFTVTPYVLASAERDFFPPESRGTEYPFEIGGDAKLGVTPSVTLDLTLNTDFAQVEVDEQQVNLTRFNLFFPEKRPFFLENAGVFAVGTPQTAELFFSRRVGIARNGEVVPILGGGRVTGKLNGFDVGLLNIQTGEVEGLQPANNYTVARGLRELGNRSRIGAIFVNRAATSDLDDPAPAGFQTEAYNRTFGVDGRLGIGSALTLDAYAAATQTPGLEGREYAYKLGGDYASRDWRGSLDFRVVGDDFNPEVGFLDRRGYRFGSGFIMHYIRPEAISWLREMRPHVSYRGFWDFDGFQETGYVHIDSHFEAPNGAFFSPAFNWTREGLQEPFEISDGVVVASGTYDNWEAAWRFNTDESAALSLNGGIDVGGFLSGVRRGGSVSITGRQGAALAGVIRLSHNIVDLPEGEFDVTLLGLRLAYAFTPRIFVQSLVQYGSQSETWSGNLRFGWLNTAGTGLFVVYNERQKIREWEDDNGILYREGPLDRALILKFTRQFDIGL